MQVTTIGLDLAKNIFQVHGISSDGNVSFNRSLRRAQLLAFFEKLEPCLIGMEACGSSHHWARQFQKLGHKVRLMPAMYVKAYVKRGKSDAIDAEAICEAVTRPTMRFVAIKTEEQQGVLFLHRARDMVVRQRTQLSNMLRGLLGEFGIVIAQGVGSAIKFAKAVLDGDRPNIPEVAVDVLVNLSNQIVALHLRILWYEKRMQLEARKDPRIMLLRTIPGIGPITASAIVATAGDGHQFRNGREFAAWLGLTPLNRSSGGKERLGRISKMGDRYVRRLLGGGYDVAPQADEGQSRPRRSMGHRSIRAQNTTSGDGCDGQQNGAHRLGSPHTQRTLQAPRGVKGETEQQRRKTIEMMEQCQPVSQDTPSNVRDTSLLSAKEFGTWSAETIRASGQVRRANRPDTRPHLTIVQISSKISCYAGDIHTRHSLHLRKRAASEGACGSLS